MRAISRATVSALGALILLPVMAAAQTAPSAERSRTEGLKETERFVKTGGETSQAVASAKLQVQKTLDLYNSLVTQTTKDMKGDYKKLMKNVDTMSERLAEARKKVEQMQQAGETYFAGRAESAKTIQDPELQNRARQRMADSQKQFADVLQSLRTAGSALEPFRKELADQITYLGSDLTPSAMSSLKPNADKLNSRGKQVFDESDKAVTAANGYFQGLRAAASS